MKDASELHCNSKYSFAKERMNLILMASLALCFYALAALENRVGIDADELKVSCVKECKDTILYDIFE